jgi:putative DNA primase/helicase
VAKGLRWRWKGLPSPRPLYGLDRLAERPDAPVVICEGEKAADAAAQVFPDCVCLTSCGGASAAAKSDWRPLAGRRGFHWPDADDCGLKYANEVAHILSSLASPCDLPIIDAMALASTTADGGNREPVEGWDAADALAEWPDIVALRSAALALAKPFAAAHAAVEDVKPAPDETAIERRIAELNALSQIKYAVARNSAARELHIPVSLLDKLVKGKRPEEDVGQGRPISFPVIEPWPEPIDGAKMLDELVAALRRYVVLTNLQADAVALWIVLTHVHDAFDVSPRLVVKSPQKRSGKTTLFSVLGRVVARPRVASGITSSALLRVIEVHCPTMLIDEMDALMGRDKEMSEALRGLMNAGFSRAFATLTMTVKAGDGGYEPREFSCWAPLALAGIGDLPETVRDRSIEIEMKRKLASETVKRLRRRDGADLNEIARKLARWSQDGVNKLHRAEPKMPDGLNDRAADAWEPLVAVADLSGGDWPNRARAAALALSGDDLAGAKDEGIDTMLLWDIRDAFARRGTDKLSGETLTAYLTGLEGRPWAEWKNSKSLTKNQLSRRLKKYGVVSCAIELGGDEGRLKGYRLEDFEDAFARYLPSRSVSTRELVLGPEKPGKTRDSELVISDPDHEMKNAEIPSNSARPHEFTSLLSLSESVSMFRGKNAPAHDGLDATSNPPGRESDGKPIWTGRAVL